MKVSLTILRECVRRHAFQLLAEGRIEDARDRYPEMKDEDFDYLVHNQPAGSNNKYLMWACKQVDEGFSSEVAIQAVRLFDGNMQRLEKKDINQYAEVGDVEAAVAALGASKGAERARVKGDTEKIWSDDRFLVLRPHTQAASCKYGTGTKWCIAATRGSNYWNSYSSSNNKFYFVIDRTLDSSDPSSKFAIAIINPSQAPSARDRIQVFNAPDRMVGLKALAGHVGDKWPEMWAAIQKHVSENPDTREVLDARKAVEEHLDTLKKGEDISREALNKVINDAAYTDENVTTIINALSKITERSDYSDPRYTATQQFANRASELSRTSAIAVIKWMIDYNNDQQSRGGHYGGGYQLDQLIARADLSPEDITALYRENPDNQGFMGSIIANPNTPDDVRDAIVAKLPEIDKLELKNRIYKRLMNDGTITREQFIDAMREPGYYGLRRKLLYEPEMAGSIPHEFLPLIPLESARDLQHFLQLPGVDPDLAANTIANSVKLLAPNDLFKILKETELSMTGLETIWAQGDQAAKTALLQNPSIGAENAAKFALSRNSAYRFAVAHNPVTPVDSLNILATDESSSTRAAVGGNQNTSPGTLKVLAGDNATIVRASVASNTSTPHRVLQVLRHDGETTIRRYAAKTLKALQAAEAIITSLRAGIILTEELTDDPEMSDIMTPSWRRLPQHGIRTEEFIAVYLLQNNGLATREELEDAYEALKGKSGAANELWRKNWSDFVYRGTQAGGAGWYWAPGGIKKGAMFRLTPTGASAAMRVLERLRAVGTPSPGRDVYSNTARPGKTYYAKGDSVALDVTGYETGVITEEELATDASNNFIMRNGKHVRLSPNRSSRARRGERKVNAYKITMPNGTVIYKKTLPETTLDHSTPVTFLKLFRGFRDTPPRAVVKKDDRAYIVKFPLMAAPMGQPLPDEDNVMPPPHTSAPPRELAPNAPAQPERPAAQPRATAAGAQARGARKASYKVYGRWKGHPAATRLRGQAYAAPQDTEFAGGEYASIEPTDDGKLRVKKLDGDHTQTWEPVEG